MALGTRMSRVEGLSRGFCRTAEVAVFNGPGAVRVP